MKNDQSKFNIFFVLIILLLLSFQAWDVFAETTVGGLITTNTTWTKANSPYVVSDSVLVNSGVTLTIEAGVTVRFNAGKALQINGGLIARGIEADKITFTANIQSPSIGYWGGIIFAPSSISAAYDSNENYLSGSILEYCVIEYVGGTSVWCAVSISDTFPLLKQCTIQNNEVNGMFINNPNSYSSKYIKIYNCNIFKNKGIGISVGWGKVSIMYNMIKENSSGGISVGRGGGGRISLNIIDNNTKSGVGGGIIYEGNDNVPIDIYHNTITNNKSTGYGGGIYLYAGAINTVRENIIKNNTSMSRGGGIYIRYGKGTILSNDFEGNIAPEGSAIYTESTDYEFKYNNINLNGSIDPLTLSTIDFGSGASFNNNNLISNIATYGIYNRSSSVSSNLNAKNNYWGTTDENEIKARIYDWFDDPTKGMVDYLPFATSNIDTFGSITGSVKNSVSGEPIVGASVSGTFGSPTTDGLGKYLISNLSPAEYTLTINARKYITSTSNNVTVSPGAQTVLDISLVPKTTGTLTGQVLNSEGLAPVSNITVKATKGIDSFTNITDVNGNFSFNDLTAGDYMVELISTSYWSNQHSAKVNIDETTQLTITGIPQSVAGEIRNGWFTQDQLNQAVTNANAAKDLIIAAMFTKTQLDKAVADANAAKDQVIAAMFTKTQQDKAVADANTAKDLVIAAMFTKTQLDKAVAEERIKWDVNNDGKMGLVEVIYILQKVAGAR